MIPYGKQDLNQEDINEVINVLKSDFITQGPKVPLFEQKISDYCNVKYSVAVNSATSALHIACMALDLNKGDWLWTSLIHLLHLPLWNILWCKYRFCRYRSKYI